MSEVMFGPGTHFDVLNNQFVYISYFDFAIKRKINSMKEILKLKDIELPFYYNKFIEAITYKYQYSFPLTIGNMDFIIRQSQPEFQRKVMEAFNTPKPYVRFDIEKRIIKAIQSRSYDDFEQEFNIPAVKSLFKTNSISMKAYCDVLIV